MLQHRVSASLVVELVTDYGQARLVLVDFASNLMIRLMLCHKHTKSTYVHYCVGHHACAPIQKYRSRPGS
jgi:hypothetical protein